MRMTRRSITFHSFRGILFPRDIARPGPGPVELGPAIARKAVPLQGKESGNSTPWGRWEEIPIKNWE